ncbi:hypothetical protein [Frateuria defendens]|uniref:hypothetical protein n=1 Tax=Frateuria defendens TaxID=2219559 RepID=UPI00066FE91C|nr:hypothetical protein [Frateuria defendens]
MLEAENAATPAPPSGHSRLGIASFALGVAAFVAPLLFALFESSSRHVPGAEAGLAEGSPGEGLQHVALGVELFTPLAALGFLTGLLAGWQTRRRKLYGRLGAVVNLLFLALACLMVRFGST